MAEADPAYSDQNGPGVVAGGGHRMIFPGRSSMKAQAEPLGRWLSHRESKRRQPQIIGPRSSRRRQQAIDRIVVSLESISGEKNSLTLPAARRALQNSLSTALDGFVNLCAYRCPTKRRRTRRRSLRTEPVLRSRSHIVAKAAAALPFIRSCDWSRMSVTEQGPSYLTKPDNLGTCRIAGRA